jgi:hypothetical protein
MTDDPTEDAGSPAPDSKPKRPPPTIDLEASEVSGDTQGAGAGSGASRPVRLRLASLLPALSGAVAALIMIGIVWATGWLGPDAQPVATAPQSVSAGLSDLSDRVGRVESKMSAAGPAVPDTALRAKLEAQETAVNGLRDDLTALRKQVDAASAALNELKSAPRASGASPDLSALTERLARVEQTVRALPDKVQTAATAADDVRLRRLVIANVLETKVRRGEPYADALNQAKALADDKSALTPLEAYAASGVPTDDALARSLLPMLSQLAAPTATAESPPATGKTNWYDRLASGASRLVRVEREGEPGSPATDVYAPLRAIANAARRNDIALVRSELEKLPPETRSRAQGWLDQVTARDAALGAAAAFSSRALAALAKAD